MLLAREEMLEKAMASNGEYDRMFITGVLSTGIYCLPSCRARKPKPENVQFFETISEAKAAGLRACKKCKPDDFFAGVDTDLDRLEAVVADIRVRPGAYPGVAELCVALDAGQSKVFESIRRHFHTTPGDLLAASRVDAACCLLRTTENSVSDIAFDVGFEALSTFYDHFGLLTGLTPTSYRKLGESESFSLSLPAGFRSDIVLSYFGRDPESLTEFVEGTSLTVGVYLGGIPKRLSLTFEDRQLVCECDRDAALEAHSLVVRMLGLRQNPGAFELHADRLGHAKLYGGRSGLRMPLTPSLYDGVVWSILGQQVNLRFAYTLRRRLTERIGVRIDDRLFAPPQAAEVAMLTVDDLLPLQYSRRKAEYLIDLSRLIDNGEIVLEQLALGSATKAEKTLLAVRGLGPWSAHYMLMRAFGFADCLPLGDSGLATALKTYFELDARPGIDETRQLMAPLSPHRTLASLHLWQSLKFES